MAAASTEPRTSSEAGDFPQFAQLPGELQDLVWQQCLPTSHVVEFDLPAPEIIDTLCSMSGTTRANVRAGTLLRICQASRRVALQAGRTPLFEMASRDWTQHNGLRGCYRILARQMVTPGDVLHLHWDQDHVRIFGVQDPTALFLAAAQRHGVSIAVTARLLVPIDPELPLGWLLGQSGVLDRLTDAVEGDPAIPAIYRVVIRTVSLHVSRAAAARSGLFGHFADEGVQLVPATDADTIQHFYALWRQDPGDDDQAGRSFLGIPGVVGVTQRIWPKHVSLWKEELETAMVRRAWYRRARTGQQFDDDALPLPSLDEILRHSLDGETEDARVQREVLRPEHPWVVMMLRRLPRIEPVVMFRLCEDGCFRCGEAAAVVQDLLVKEERGVCPPSDILNIGL